MSHESWESCGASYDHGDHGDHGAHGPLKALRSLSCLPEPSRDFPSPLVSLIPPQNPQVADNEPREVPRRLTASRDLGTLGERPEGFGKLSG
jgi:hypothetical protein